VSLLFCSSSKKAASLEPDKVLDLLLLDAESLRFFLLEEDFLVFLLLLLLW